MTAQQKQAIAYYREKGMSYSTIGQRMSLPTNTIKSYCSRHGLSSSDLLSLSDTCAECKKALVHIPGHKKKRFCSETCRRTWWGNNRLLMDQKAFTDHICAGCGKSFKSYGNEKRKYCSHSCYIITRFGKEEERGKNSIQRRE